MDISKDGRALQKLRREAERAKRALSSQHQVRVEVESLAEGVDLSEPLTRARFEELNNDLFKKTLGPVKRVCFLLLSKELTTCVTASACLLSSTVHVEVCLLCCDFSWQLPCLQPCASPPFSLLSVMTSLTRQATQ